MAESTTAAEMAELKREFDRLRNRVDTLEAQKAGILDGLAAKTGLSRRQLIAIAGAGGALGAYGAGEARGAAQPNGGEGDVGSTSSPFEGFADGLAKVVEDISSATTVTKPVVRYDPSVSGFTITLGTELEGPSGFSQPVVLQEVGGSGNSVTVDTESGNNIDGGASITLDHANAVTVLYWTGSEWRTDWFTVTANVGTLTADVLNSADVSAATEGHALTKAASGTDLEFEAVGGGGASFSGTYSGDGSTSNSITGVGFQPTYLKIWEKSTSDSAPVSVFEVTAEINDDVTNAAIEQTGESSSGPQIISEKVVSLDSDGFTVTDASGDFHPNKNGTDYNFIAIE